jgi:Glycosyltransferase sugar-binding region containing DXD motif
MRLQVLQEYGGVYMDIDTVSLRPWRPLFNHEFVMAWQDSSSEGTSREGKVYGLCNAGMLSAKKSRFSELWLQSYVLFRSNGRDRFWDEHSVTLPADLTENYPTLITRGLIHTISANRMWVPLWMTVQKELLHPNAKRSSYREVLSKYPESFMLHLWVGGESSHKDLLEQLENSTQWLVSTRYGAIARRYVEANRHGFGRRFMPRKLDG